MDIDKLYKSLKNAYTSENLTKISSKIIESYKKKEHSFIRNLAKKINETVTVDLHKINKTFSKLIMLYHPDKLNHYQKEIEEYYKLKDIDKLTNLSHILKALDNKEPEIKEQEESTAHDPKYSSEADWGFYDTDFETYYSDEENYDDEESYEYEPHNFDFLSALKLKEYGNLHVSMKPEHLTLIEGSLELSNYEINDLFGVEFCKNITSLDLSNNHIVNITKIKDLYLLEEVYLSDNYISNIEALKKLENLKIVDLSYNDIDDIEPLLDMDNLEYINIIGNSIPRRQIEALENNKVIVIY